MSKTFVRPIVVCVAVLWVLAGAAGPLAGAAAQKPLPEDARIILLHHSTGECIWNGGVAAWFNAYNAAHKTRYTIVEQNFPKESPYGWENYPYDYWNIWVRHAGAKPFKQEPTLEILTAKYNVIVFKHCFPVSSIEADTGRPDVTSRDKRVENYKLQYAALKKKLRAFPKVRFLVWTGAALLSSETDAASAGRAKAFFDWVRTRWDDDGDNIFVWDFRRLETDGGLYLKRAHAAGDSHPNETFSKRVAPLLCRRIVDVIAGRGDSGSVTGEGGKPLVVPPTKPPVKPPAKEPVKQPVKPAPPVKAPTAGPGKWLFDNAEDPKRLPGRWDQAAKYVKDGKQNAVQIAFADGKEEDWGEYGKTMIVYSHRPEKNQDIKAYNYLAFRVKADREMEIVFTLLTLPKPRGPLHQSHFGFTAYVRPAAGAWKWVVLDLTKLELAAEGEAAYAAAGKPNRPMALTAFKICTNKKNAKARVLLDDIVFLRELPAALKAHLQAP